MPPLIACAACGQHVLSSACACAHCGAKLKDCGLRSTAAAALMGLALAACGDKDGNDSDSPIQTDYGFADSGYSEDLDGDGYTVAEGDCDDNNPNAYPGAAEAADDGIDTNCDGNPNT
jgi:hypothetical protein